MISRLLCKVGFHDWSSREAKNGDIYVLVMTCRRCGKKQIGAIYIKQGDFSMDWRTSEPRQL
jgi:hypothetical protein